MKTVSLDQETDGRNLSKSVEICQICAALEVIRKTQISLNLLTVIKDNMPTSVTFPGTVVEGLGNTVRPQRQ